MLELVAGFNTRTFPCLGVAAEDSGNEIVLWNFHAYPGAVRDRICIQILGHFLQLHICLQYCHENDLHLE